MYLIRFLPNAHGCFIPVSHLRSRQRVWCTSTAIEEELEVLYDAYYEELEQYANYQQRYVSSGGTIPPPPGPGPFPGSVELDKNGAVISPNSKSPHPPSRTAGKQTNGINGRKPSHPPLKQQPESEFDTDDDEGDEDYAEDDDYDEEEEGEDEDEEEEDEEVPEEEEEKPTRGSRHGRGAQPARRRSVAPAKANGHDGLFGSLTVTGTSISFIFLLFDTSHATTLQVRGTY